MKERNPISMEDAQVYLAQITAAPKTERIKTMEALKRVCSSDIYAAIDLPPFSRSPLDGYAVRGEDTRGASRERPVGLRVIENVYAGMFPKKRVNKGEAVRIMTGAPIPQGADAVIRQEDTDEGEGTVNLYACVNAYDNYCYAGEDTKKGTLLIEKGTELGAAHIGILASQGIRELEVYTVPLIAVMATGDELQAAHSQLEPGCIYDSNGPMLTARLTQLGIHGRQLMQTPDNPAQLAESIKEALETCDALITCGGVSVGAHDYMPEAARILNANVLFHGINVRPGSPMLVMLVDEKPVFCLSGNPFAAAATFEALVRPVLERMRGKKEWKPARYTAVLKTGYPKPSPLRRLVRGRYENGQVWLPKGRHSSGMIVSMAECNCLVDIPAESPALAPGELVCVLGM